MDLNILPVVQVAGIGIARSFFGWAENALKDGKISKFEISQLGATVVRVGMIAVALFYGVNGIWGKDITLIAAGAGAIVGDFILKKIRK